MFCFTDITLKLKDSKEGSYPTMSQPKNDGFITVKILISSHGRRIGTVKTK